MESLDSQSESQTRSTDVILANTGDARIFTLLSSLVNKLRIRTVERPQEESNNVSHQSSDMLTEQHLDFLYL